MTRRAPGTSAGIAWQTGDPATTPAVVIQDGSPSVAERARDLLVAVETPVWAAALVLVAAILLVLWWRLYRRRSPGEQLQSRLAALEEVAVLMHPNPDPDAMASAMAVGRIAEQVDTPATLQYPGTIRHPQNRAFVTVLDLDLDRIERAADLAADDVVLVDHHEPRGFEGADAVDPCAVVDHHPGSESDAGFHDVRDGYGSCAAILGEYLEELDAERVDGDPEGDGPTEADGGEDRLPLSTDLATGLTFGVLSDTTYLTRGASDGDFTAVKYLHPAADEDLLDRIANPQSDAAVLETRARAILEREERPPYVISDVGGVENLDAIPEAADELLELEGATVAAVLGHDDDVLSVSCRSRDDRVHAGRALEAALGDIEGAGAGGHPRMGGGQVPLAELSELRPGDGVIQQTGTMTREQLRERLFAAMAGEL